MKFDVQIRSILKNVSYSFIANIISLSVSVLMVLFVPKILGVKDYGLWQLYIFYSSYLGFFHFGWLDGIYLRYGGYYFEKLNKKLFTGQFISLLLFEFLISFVGFCVITLTVEDMTLRQIGKMIFIVLPIVILSTFNSFILQITNRIKKYAQITVVERFCFAIGVTCYLMLGNKSFYGLLIIDLLTKTMGFIVGLLFVRNLFVVCIDKIISIREEIFKNISVGSKLLLANIAGILIVGIVRFGISQEWDVATFGKVSLTLSISNFLMVFINSLSVVFFPILKRIDERKQKSVYLMLRNILSFVLFAAVLAYYPLQYILSWWLPKYKEALVYMAILFPICLYESKVVLLTNTYLKSFRAENAMMKINFVMVLISVALTYLSVVIFNSLDLVVLSILILFMLKSIIAELVLSNLLKIDLKINLLQEILLTVVFVGVNFISSDWMINIIVYTIAYLVYFFFNRHELYGMEGLVKRGVIG